MDRERSINVLLLHDAPLSAAKALMEQNPKRCEWLKMKTELTSTDKQERERSDDERLKRISAVAFCLEKRKK